MRAGHAASRDISLPFVSACPLSTVLACYMLHVRFPDAVSPNIFCAELGFHGERVGCRAARVASLQGRVQAACVCIKPCPLYRACVEVQHGCGKSAEEMGHYDHRSACVVCLCVIVRAWAGACDLVPLHQWTLYVAAPLRT